MRRWRRTRHLSKTKTRIISAMNPMEQFEIAKYARLFSLFGHDIYFTNQALAMCLVVGVASLFLTLAVKQGALVPSRLQSMAEISYEFVANMIQTSAGEKGLK